LEVAGFFPAFAGTALAAGAFAGGRLVAGAGRFDADALATGAALVARVLGTGLVAALDGEAAPRTARGFALGRVADLTGDFGAALEDLGMAFLSRSVGIRID
jgi:hypothetical protein